MIKEPNKVTFSPFFKGNAEVVIETTLDVVEDKDISTFENNPSFGVFRIIDQAHGDKRLVWNRLNMNDIREADSMFKNFISQGLEAFRVGGDGKTGSKMDAFDPTAEEIIFLPIKLVTAG